MAAESKRKITAGPVICDKQAGPEVKLLDYMMTDPVESRKRSRPKSYGTLKTVYRNDYNKRKNVISQTSKRRFKIKDQESKSIQIKN